MEFDPKLIPAQMNLGIAYARTKQYTQAYNTFIEIIALNPRIAEAHYHPAHVCLTLKLSEECRMSQH